MIKILIHGFGAFPLFFKPLIEIARRNNTNIEWSAIIPTSNHVHMMQQLLGENNVLYLHDQLNEMMENSTLNSVSLAGYRGNIYKDIETDKKILKSKPAKRQLYNAISTYLIYKEFLEKIQPTHILFPHVETPEGMILSALAEELGIEKVFYCHSRNLGESFFSDSITEAISKYAKADNRSIKKAERFLQSFSNSHITSEKMPDLLEQEQEIMTIPIDSFPKRVCRFINNFIREREKQSWAMFYVRILNNIPFYRNTIWKLREFKNSKCFDVDKLESLPAKFIYYPLQYSPESSINVPAPYYIDQRRVIDAIRFSMPNDTMLVIKEHPNCIQVRPGSFVHGLRNCAGVVVAHYKMDSRELIKRADLTISVTGTAALEAFLLSRPSLVMAGTFFSEFIGGECTIENLSTRIRDAMKMKVDYNYVKECIAKIYNVTLPFVLRSPNSGIKGDTTMYKQNIELFLEALIRHIELKQDHRK